MPKEIHARCPVCGEWQKMEPAFIGKPKKCRNCLQEVTLIPETSQRRAMRKAAVIVLPVLIALGLWLIYHLLNPEPPPKRWGVGW